MKKHLIYFFGLILITFYSCAPTSTEIWVNKDGSGSTKSTMDLGEYFDMMGPMLESFGDEMNQDETDTEQETGEDEAINLSDAMWENDEEDIDSTIVIFDIMPDSVKALLDHPEYMKNITMHMKTNSEDRTAFMSLKIDFDDMDHYAAIQEELKKSKQEEGTAMGTSGGEDLDAFFQEFIIDTKKKTITFPEVNIMEDIENDSEMQEFYSKLDSIEHFAEDSYERMMIDMLFSSEMSYTIHAPNKIKSCSRKDATIDGSTVKFTLSMMESIKEGIQEEIVIKYK